MEGSGTFLISAVYFTYGYCTVDTFRLRICQHCCGAGAFIVFIIVRLVCSWGKIKIIRYRYRYSNCKKYKIVSFHLFMCLLNLYF